MAIAIDTTRELRRPSDLLALVEAVEHALESDETWWIEWKTGLDLTTSAGAFKAARAILSFANRMPDAVASICGGLAYFVLGAEPNNVVGTAAIDGAELEQHLLKYLGSDGPVWSPQYITVSDKTVLVIIVEAPRWGDPIHTLRKSYDKDDDGTVFVRSQARSRPANSAEMRLLAERLVRGVREPGLEGIDVSCRVGEPGEVMVINPTPDAIEEWLEARRKAVTEWQERKVAARNQETTNVWRSRVNENAIAEHVEQCREHLFDAQRRFLGRGGWSQVTVSALNQTLGVLEDVELTLTLPGEWSAFTEDDPKLKDLEGLPPGPRLLDPIAINRWPAGPGRSLLGRLPTPAFYDPNIHIEPTMVTLQLGQLRPEKPREATPFTLVLHEQPEPSELLTVGWSLTSTSRSGVLRGEMHLPVNSRRRVWLLPEDGLSEKE